MIDRTCARCMLAGAVVILATGCAEPRPEAVDPCPEEAGPYAWLDGECYTRIQEAVNAAGEGATITLDAGTFYEDVQLGQESQEFDFDCPDSVCGPEDLIIRGAGMNTTIIDGREHSVVSLWSGSYRLTDMTLQGGVGMGAYDPFGGGLAIMGGVDAELENVAIRDNTAEYGGGIYLRGTLVGRNVVISKNSGYVSPAIYVGGVSVLSTSLTLSASTVEANTAGEYDRVVGGAITAYSQGEAKLTFNEGTYVTENEGGDYGAFHLSGVELTIEDSTVRDNDGEETVGARLSEGEYMRTTLKSINSDWGEGDDLPDICIDWSDETWSYGADATFQCNEDDGCW